MCLGCPKEPSHRDGSFEYPLHMFWLRNKKKKIFYTLLSGTLHIVCKRGFLLLKTRTLGSWIANLSPGFYEGIMRNISVKLLFFFVWFEVLHPSLSQQPIMVMSNLHESMGPGWD